MSRHNSNVRLSTHYRYSRFRENLLTLHSIPWKGGGGFLWQWDSTHDGLHSLSLFSERGQRPASTQRSIPDTNENTEAATPMAISPSLPPLRILLMGTADTGYLFKTLANFTKHGSRPLYFCILEPQVPLLARHLLFLYLCFDPAFDELNALEKEQLYLELYGNLTLSEKTHTWLQTQIPTLIRLVTDQKNKISKCFNFDALKFRERDDLEAVFKFWGSSKPFEIEKMWEHRLMNYYRSRYDARENLVDWDYHMKLAPKLPQLSRQAFVAWRRTGAAFRARETGAQHANRTLASVCDRRWGYWSDIGSGPLVACAAEQEGSWAARFTALAHLRGDLHVQFLTCDPARCTAPTDVTCVGASMAHLAGQCPAAITLVESIQYAVEINAAGVQTYAQKVSEIMRAAGYLTLEATATEGNRPLPDHLIFHKALLSDAT